MSLRDKGAKGQSLIKITYNVALNFYPYEPLNFRIDMFLGIFILEFVSNFLFRIYVSS